jgi:hypothetical protein
MPSQTGTRKEPYAYPPLLHTAGCCPCPRAAHRPRPDRLPAHCLAELPDFHRTERASRFSRTEHARRTARFSRTGHTGRTSRTSRTSNAPAPGTPAGNGAGGPGSIALVLTSPRAISEHLNTTVTCSTGRLYRASGGGTSPKGYTLRIAATAVGYTGPASYTTAITGSIVSPDGESFALAAARTTAALTSTGGSVPFSATGNRGRTLAGSITWSCS